MNRTALRTSVVAIFLTLGIAVIACTKVTEPDDPISSSVSGSSGATSGSSGTTSGSSSTTNGSSSTTSASSGTTSGSGGGSASATEVCAVLSSYATKCNLTPSACDEMCAQSVAPYSQAALTVVGGCAQSMECGDAGMSDVQTCISSKIAALPPSAAQSKLAQDYCAACASADSQTPEDCVATFYQGGDTTGTVGIGSLVAVYNDSILTSIDTQCIPTLADAGQLGCALGLIGCASAIIEPLVPPACQTSSSGAGGAASGP